MTFKKEDREASLIYQDVSPDAEMQADHIVPKSKGGADDVANLQYLFPEANRAKSNHVFVPRQWQLEFMREWDRSTDDSFLCVAIPGGGKTRAALLAAHRFLQMGHDRRVLIVGPTVNVRRQWEVEALTLLGVKLQTREFGTSFKSGFVGGVATYQMLVSSTALFRKICAAAPTLVILDEPHHLEEGAGAWGGSARVAFELAQRRLLLSGTPFRTNGRPIPFVRYDGAGYCLPHYRYDYPDALQDNVVRSLVFDYSHGSYEELFEGERRTHEFHGELSEEQAAERLRQILNPSGEFVAQVVRLAHAKLKAVRRAIPDAGAMAVCIDMAHAQRVAEVIRRETGRQPSIVVSDEEIATDSVDEYRRGQSEWLVSVRQVSEGTDIKRLQVLCYLTTATTELSFRQLIGRVSRVRFQDPESPRAADDAELADLEAFVFLPADPRLIVHAQNIEAAQLRALATIADDDDGTRTPGCERDRQAQVRMFLGSEHKGLDTLIVGGRSYTEDEATHIQSIVAYGVKTETAARIFDGLIRGRAQAPPQTLLSVDVPTETEEDQINRTRKRCHKLANAYAKVAQVDVREVHAAWPPHRTMGLADLKQKEQQLLKLLREAHQ
jgi:superfamily II DNA or RNA helicase